MANGTKELNTSPITILDEIDEFSDKPVMSKTIAKALKDAGGGMPADYPYEVATLFEGNVRCDDEQADIEGLEAPAGTPIKVTINGTTTDLFYDEDNAYWSDTNPYSSSDSTIEFGNGDEGNPAWLWMKDAPNGTYAVKIEGNAINGNFRSAVEEITGSQSSAPIKIYIDGSTQSSEHVGYKDPSLNSRFSFDDDIPWDGSFIVIAMANGDPFGILYPNMAMMSERKPSKPYELIIYNPDQTTTEVELFKNK